MFLIIEMFSVTVPAKLRLHSRLKLIVWPKNPPFHLHMHIYIIFTNELYLQVNLYTNGKIQETLNIKEQLVRVT